MASSGSSQGSQDWADFQAIELENAIERALLILRSRCLKALVVCGVLSDVALFSGSWREVILSPRLLVYILTVIAHFGGPRLRRLTHRHPLQTGCTVQLVIMICLFLSSVLLSVRMKNELMQHRVFLTAHMVHMVLLQCVTYFPFWFNAGVATPVVTLTWFSFHAFVGFWSIAMIIFAIFYNVVLPLFIANLMEKLRWQQFQANRQLDLERKILEDTQSTLHSMLSSQWDASCTCHETGLVLSSTPHLEQLLGGGQDVVGCDLCCFAAGDDDAGRLTGFLQSVASSVESQALTLQCTVRPRQFSPEPGCTTRPFDVSFYGIKLPQGARFQNNSCDRDCKSLFIGVKAIDENAAAHTVDGPPVDENLDDLCVDAMEDICEDAHGLSESDSNDAEEVDVAARSHVGSRASTTFTGHVFGAIANASKEETFGKGLEAISKIGAAEHWLVSRDHVQLLPDAVLGTGGFGVVLLGLVHGTHVALKFPRLAKNHTGQSLRTLINELRILRHVRHPNCVSFYGACIDAQNDAVALVFEFVQGKTLKAIVRNLESPPTPSCRLSLILDICCAIRYLHALSPQIVHGDLKPSNVLVEELVQGFRAKVLDFGLSCLMTRNRGGLGGTVEYMAPEVILRTLSVQGPSADVFSFGRLAHFVVSGLSPFPDAGTAEIRSMAFRGCFEPMDWPPAPLCKECEALCKDTLKFDAAERPSMRSVHAAILAWVVPEAPLPSIYDGGCCKPVEWLDGLSSMWTRFGDDQAVYSFIDLTDTNLQLLKPSRGWLSFFGDTPIATGRLPDCVQLVSSTEHWIGILQSWANRMMHAGIGLENEMDLTEGYVTSSKGKVYKSNVFVSSSVSSTQICSQSFDFLVKVRLGKFRRVRLKDKGRTFEND